MLVVRSGCILHFTTQLLGTQLLGNWARDQSSDCPPATISNASVGFLQRNLPAQPQSADNVLAPLPVQVHGTALSDNDWKCSVVRPSPWCCPSSRRSEETRLPDKRDQCDVIRKRIVGLSWSGLNCFQPVFVSNKPDLNHRKLGVSEESSPNWTKRWALSLVCTPKTSPHSGKLATCCLSNLPNWPLLNLTNLSATVSFPMEPPRGSLNNNVRGNIINSFHPRFCFARSPVCFLDCQFQRTSESGTSSRTVDSSLHQIQSVRTAVPALNLTPPTSGSGSGSEKGSSTANPHQTNLTHIVGITQTVFFSPVHFQCLSDDHDLCQGHGVQN